MRTIFTVLIVMTFCTTSQAAERWEGIWAQTRHECADKEGPSSRTLIDLSNKEKGQLAPIYDQYENHCRIKGVSRKDGTVILHITCFEFLARLQKQTLQQTGFRKNSLFGSATH